MKKLDAKISKLSDLLSETTATDALIQKIEEFANRRDALNDQLSTLEVVRKQSKAMREIKESDVKAMLSAMTDTLPDLDRNALKDLLRSLVESITS
jgi:CHASE3 domain sensor protein